MLRRALEAADYFVPADTLWNMDVSAFLRAVPRIIRDANTFGPYEEFIEILESTADAPLVDRPYTVWVPHERMTHPASGLRLRQLSHGL